MGAALFNERQYWANMSRAISAGIAKAFNG